MSLASFMNFLHRKSSKNGYIVQLATLIRNQCNCIIRYHLGESSHSGENGESWLIRAMAEDIRMFVDVGANVGDWTDELLSLRPQSTKGILFEPSSVALEHLYSKFENNKDVEIVAAAVSNEIGELSFFEEPESGETSSLIGSYSNSLATKSIVAVTTLDAELGKRQISRVDFLKIDTEGYDLHVLKGCQYFLGKQSVKIIQFEYNSPWAMAGSTLADAYKLLENFGYKVFLLKSNGLYKINYHNYGEYYGYSNFVAVSPEMFSKMEVFVKGHI